MTLKNHFNCYADTLSSVKRRGLAQKIDSIDLLDFDVIHHSQQTFIVFPDQLVSIQDVTNHLKKIVGQHITLNILP